MTTGAFDLESITWRVKPSLHASFINGFRRTIGEDDYRNAVLTLKIMLCSYFETGQCNFAQGDTIIPIGATPDGFKVLKVRLGYAGCGKSGGLRLAVKVHCRRRLVAVTYAAYRRGDPQTEDILQSARDYVSP